MPAVLARMQDGRRRDLLPNIGRRIDDEPTIAVDGDGQTGLGPRGDSRVAHPNKPANRAAAIPLRNAAAGRRTEDDRSHGRADEALVPPRWRLELDGVDREIGRLVARHFHADAHFLHDWL